MQKTWRSTTLVAYTLAILAFLYLPLVILTLYSFNDSRINAVWAGFTLKWYASLLSNDRVLEALTNSLLIASITTVVATIMGTLAAIALHRYQYRSKTVLNSLLYLPILIPEIVMGLSLLILFSQLGLSLGKPSLIVRTSPSACPLSSSPSEPVWKEAVRISKKLQATFMPHRCRPSAM